MWSEVNEVEPKTQSESKKVFLAVPEWQRKVCRAKCTSGLFRLLRSNPLGDCLRNCSVVPNSTLQSINSISTKATAYQFVFEEVGDEISRHLIFQEFSKSYEAAAAAKFFVEDVQDGNC